MKVDKKIVAYIAIVVVIVAAMFYFGTMVASNSCPGDMAKVDMTQCKAYGKYFIPTDQNTDHIASDYPTSECGRDITTQLIACRDCLDKRSAGWMCIVKVGDVNGR